jgi:hypothetical protein
LDELHHCQTIVTADKPTYNGGVEIDADASSPHFVALFLKMYPYKPPSRVMKLFGAKPEKKHFSTPKLVKKGTYSDPAQNGMYTVHQCSS